MKQGVIKAVHDSDLESFLKSLEEYDAVIEGKRHCYYCNQIVSMDNIISIFPGNETVNYCCNNDNCYYLLIKKVK